MSTFQQVRSQAMGLENKVQQALSTYSSFAQSTSASATADEVQAENQVEKFLTQSDEMIKKLTMISEQDLNLPASKLQQLQRQRQVNQDQIRDFNRIRNTIKEERNRMNLLFNVRNDIDAHQDPSHTAAAANKQLSEDDYIQEERQRVDQSNSIVDRLISDALHTRDNFQRQSSSLTASRTRLTNSLSQIPGINSLIKRINTRKKRDSVILASLITFMIILLWFIS